MLLGNVSVTGGEQALDQLTHRLDVFRCTRLDVRGQATKRIGIRMKLLLGFFRDDADCLVERQVRILLRRARNDLVVHVRDVADIDDVIAAVDIAQQAKQHIEYDQRPRIADMGKVVNGRPAHVHAHPIRIERRKNPLLPGQRVVELQLHCTVLSGSPRARAASRTSTCASACWPGVQKSR